LAVAEGLIVAVEKVADSALAEEEEDLKNLSSVLVALRLLFRLLLFSSASRSGA
jgi:hypothetical protein